MNFYVVGAGHVGRAVIQLLCRAGHTCLGASNQSAESAQATLAATGIAAVEHRHARAPDATDLVWVTVPDRFIASVTEELWVSQRVPKGACLVHTSGALEPDVLRSAAPGVRAVASAHPLQSFADETACLERAERATWFVSGDEFAVNQVTATLASSGLKALPLPAVDRALYHAAAVLASNSLVALASTAAQLTGVGEDERAALDMALLELMEGTVENIRQLGTQRALTGPIVRGDHDTIVRHLRAIEKTVPELTTHYKALSRLIVRVARRRSDVPAAALSHIEELLDEVNPSPPD